MSAYLYILECADGSYYVGSTRDIDTRFMQHQSGRGAKYTATRRPVRLVFCQVCEHIGEAYGLELQIHGWSRAKRKALIDGHFELLPELSRNRRNRGASGPDSAA